jgi:hypothetical protein
MAVAALVLLAAGVGVNYGWQPMPDGSSRYEYIVQVDPELLETLESEQSIPLVSEVPEGVQPIGRIRVIVGRGDVPRQKLSTHLKPADAGAGATGDGAIELAQFNQYGGATQRYAPQGGAATASADASSWNGGDGCQFAQPAAAATTPLSASPVAQGAASGAASTWNEGASSPVTGAGGQGPMARVGETIDSATAPLRQGLQRAGESIQSTAGNLGDRTRNLVDELGKPFQPRTTRPESAGAAVGGSNPNITSAPAWNGAPAAATAVDSAGARYQGQGSSWNDDDAAAPPLASAPPFGTAQPPSTPPLRGVAEQSGARPESGTASRWNAGDSTTAQQQRLDQPLDPKDVGRWDDDVPRTARNAAPAGSQNGLEGQPSATAPAGRRDARAGSTTPGATPGDDFPPAWAGGGPQFPSLGQPSEGASVDPLRDAKPRADMGISAADSTSPEIRSGMLGQPADRPLDGSQSASTARAGGAAASFPTAPPLATSRTSQPPTARAGAAAAQGWDWATRGGQSAVGIQDAADKAAGSSGARQGLTALFAWVLLTGSAAGNLYLFWSYQDVRHKYRSLVRKTARAVGSRLSPA